MEDEPKIKFEISAPALDVIFRLLYEAPYKVANPIIALLQAQVAAHNARTEEQKE